MADNTGILSILECPVCLEYIVPPIHQCVNQHLLCAACRKGQVRCPICRVELKHDRNLCMEKVAEYVLYPCKNEANGCTARLRLSEMRAHAWTCCGDGQYHCFETMSEEEEEDDDDGDYPPCDWTGSHVEMDDHIRQKHGRLINNSVDGIFSSSASSMVDFKYILFDDNLFCVIIHTDPLRTSSIHKVFTCFFHIVSITCGGENCYAYNVKIEGQDDKFEGFVGRLIRSHTDIRDMARRHECLHFMANKCTFSFEGNIVKL